MVQETWSAVDAYLTDRLIPPDPALDDALRDSIAAGLPQHNVAPNQGSKAIKTLSRLAEEGAGPFDLVFIDADKPNNPHYLEWSLKLSRPGTVIIGDNVVRGGAVADHASTDPNVVGVRRCLDFMVGNPRLSATAIQTVGGKGYDGFSLAMVEY